MPDNFADRKSGFSGHGPEIVVRSAFRMNRQILMNRLNISRREWENWRGQIHARVTTLNGLAQAWQRPLAAPDSLRFVLKSYPLAVTPYYLSLIDPDDEADPLARQCLPDAREVSLAHAGLADPLDEDGRMPVPNLIHRYSDRVLAMVTRSCAVYCRHCNRKRFWKMRQEAGLQSRLAAMVRYVQNAPQVREVILSGGDPLMHDDDRLEAVLAAFKSVPHVEVLRIGTRTPVVLPMRITKDLCRMLRRYRPLWLNTQFNHPAEITKDAARACAMLLEAGIPVSNQSVLLQGVNDSPDVMRRLLHGLQKIAVRPYYLFHCEPVRGCLHLRTSVAAGLALMEELRRDCSGLALPQYVADLPGEAGKVPLLCLSETLKNDLQKHQDFFDNLK